MRRFRTLAALAFAVVTVGGPALLRGPVALAATASPTLVAPAPSSTLGDFGPTLRWSNPPDATQVQLQVIPAKNDGPGVDVYLGSPATSFTLPAPPDWYGLLPGMTYTWRVRASNSTAFATGTDASWSEWTQGTFRSPSTSFRDALPSSPSGAQTVDTLTPTLRWTAPSWIYYFELQLSKDPTFNTNPATATAMVYQALLHGGVTNPANSYAVPRSFPLEPGTRYYWRVRPRVQGDGTPVDWSQVLDTMFITAATAKPDASPTPSPTPQATATPVITATAVPTFTATPIGSPTALPTMPAQPVDTVTPVTSPTAMPGSTGTPVATPTTGVTATPTTVVTATATSTPIPSATATPASSPTASGMAWLDRVNALRFMANLPALTNNPAWTQGCLNHSRYMVENNLIAHQENSSLPFATTEGNDCGSNGNVATGFSSGAPKSDTDMVDGWMTAPFHGLGFIDPRLKQSAFGRYDAVKDGFNKWGGSIDVLRSIDWSVQASYPIMWPAAGKTTNLTAYNGGEFPAPLSGCTGFAADSSGAPIYVQFGTGGSVPQVSKAELRMGNDVVPVCAFDETNFSNPDASAQSLARAILNMRNAVVLMPRDPLVKGATYTASITNRGQTTTWSFTVQ